MTTELFNQWSIVAHAFPIKHTPFHHNFWVLNDARCNVIDQIHGMAVNPQTGVLKAIGTSSDLLQVVRTSNITWPIQPKQPTVICATGHEIETKERWQAAINSIVAINQLQLPYPNLWQHFYKKNSNTVFNTMGKIMGFTIHDLLLPRYAPGIQLVISEDIINHYRYQ